MDSERTRTHRLSRKRYGQLLAGVVAVLVFLGILYYANHDRPTYHSSDTSGITYEVAQVTGILKDNKTVDEATGLWQGSMDLQVKILTGEHKNENATVTNYFSALYNVRVSQGDKVSIRIDTSEDGSWQASVYNYYRIPGLVGCVGVFLLLLVGIGGKKGAKSAIGLVFTVICIIWILLPLSLKG